MLKIRDQQLTAFEADSRARFENGLVAMVRAHWPAHAATSDEDLRAQLGAAAQRAADYGIKAPADVTRFINLTLALGPEFDTDERYPWAKIFLADPVMAPTAKLDRMIDRARQAMAKQNPSQPK